MRVLDGLLFCLCAAILVTTGCQTRSRSDVVLFGAVGDGVAVNTAAIQRAIDACAASGGGRVRIPAGRFVTGTVVLKGGVTLHLDKGATLLGSTEINDYRIVDSFKEGTGQNAGLFLLGSVDASNVGIEGEGTIDGQGSALQKAKLNGAAIRPFLVRWIRSDHVAVSGVTFTKSAMWCMHIAQCKDVAIDHVTILNKGNANNDGIDVDSSERVQVRDCDIDTSDDAVCLKATTPAACRDVMVSGCRLKSNCAAVKLGTESVGDFENISVTHCQIRETRLGGLKVLSVDGAHVSNLVFSDITMDAVSTPLFLRLGSRLKTYHVGDKPRVTGSISGIRISNIVGRHCTGTGIFITGVPGHRVGGDIVFDNVDLGLAGGADASAAAVKVPEKEGAYPEISAFGKVLPASGVYARHVEGVRITGLKISEERADGRPVVGLQDAEGVALVDCALPGVEGGMPVVVLDGVSGLAWERVTAGGKVVDAGK